MSNVVLTDGILDLLNQRDDVVIPCINAAPQVAVEKGCNCPKKTKTTIVTDDYNYMKTCLMNDSQQLEQVRSLLNADKLIVFLRVDNQTQRKVI